MISYALFYALSCALTFGIAYKAHGACERRSIRREMKRDRRD